MPLNWKWVHYTFCPFIFPQHELNWLKTWNCAPGCSERQLWEKSSSSSTECLVNLSFLHLVLSWPSPHVVLSPMEAYRSQNSEGGFSLISRARVLIGWDKHPFLFNLSAFLPVALGVNRLVEVHCRAEKLKPQCFDRRTEKQSPRTENFYQRYGKGRTWESNPIKVFNEVQPWVVRTWI